MQEEFINDSMNCSDVKKKNAAVKEQSLQNGARENCGITRMSGRKDYRYFFNLSIFVIRLKPTKCI